MPRLLRFIVMCALTYFYGQIIRFAQYFFFDDGFLSLMKDGFGIGQDQIPDLFWNGIEFFNWYLFIPVLSLFYVWCIKSLPASIKKSRQVKE